MATNKDCIPLGLTLLMVVAITCGCLSPNKASYRYYSLDAAMPDSFPGDNWPTVCIAAVNLPSYLDRPQIVSRSGSRVTFAEFDRWAEPLEVGLARAFRYDLTGQLAKSDLRVVADCHKDCRIEICMDFERFEIVDNKFVVWGRYTICDKTSGKTVSDHIMMSADNCTAGDYDRMCEKVSLLLKMISGEIAKSVSSLAGL